MNQETANRRSLTDESVDHRGFYVPRYEVKVEGAGLPQDVLRDVVQVTYTDDVDQLDTFTLTVNNANDEALARAQPPRAGAQVVRRFKYIGSETADDLAGAQSSNRYRLFEPCSKEVQLFMGYGGDLELMMTGSFTTMEPSFAASGASTLEVRGINVLHQLRRRKYSDHWAEKTRSEIAEIVGSRRRRRNDDTRLELQLCVNNNAKANESPVEFVAQKNEYDVDFLWKLARREGYVLAVREANEQQPRHIYFGPSGGVANCNVAADQETEFQAPVAFELAWGQSLIELTPRLTSANQFKSVTVNGWNRRRQRPITYTARFTDREIRRLNSDLHELLVRCDPREELVVDEPVFSQRDAKRRAQALLLDQHKQMVKVSGSTVGLPGLRAGLTVQISGIGTRLSGQYFVTKTVHTLNDSGYITRFEARREHIPEAN